MKQYSEMSTTKQIYWFNGCWNNNHQLSIPIEDRGLNLGDGIFETILILKGRPQLLEEHIYRWTQSANDLGMLPPPPLRSLTPLIEKGLLGGKMLRPVLC